MQRDCAWPATALSLLIIMGSAQDADAGSKPSPELARHLTGIARLAQPSPVVTIPAGPFLLGSKRVDDDLYGNWTQFDDTELPQHRVWLDTYEMDRDEVSLGESWPSYDSRSSILRTSCRNSSGTSSPSIPSRTRL